MLAAFLVNPGALVSKWPFGVIATKAQRFTDTQSIKSY